MGFINRLVTEGPHLLDLLDLLDYHRTYPFWARVFKRRTAWPIHRSSVLAAHPPRVAGSRPSSVRILSARCEGNLAWSRLQCGNWLLKMIIWGLFFHGFFQFFQWFSQHETSKFPVFSQHFLLEWVLQMLRFIQVWQNRFRNDRGES